jgi:hypothetical protein
MGHSSAIVAVDLDKLKAAVGSRDAALVRKLRPKKAAPSPNDGPRVLVGPKGELYLNREPVTFDELQKRLRQRKWKGTDLFYCDSRGGHRVPGFEDRMRFRNSIINPIPHWQFESYAICFNEDELYSGFDDDEITEERAAAELVEGRVTRPDEGHQYGYGLEKLCRLLGTFLVGIEGKGGMLAALKLNTPLAKERSPVRLPKARDEFPVIGYLTAAEVEREVKRLDGLDLSYPRSELIEADRKELVRALKKAAKKAVGVVAFYH